MLCLHTLFQKMFPKQGKKWDNKIVNTDCMFSDIKTVIVLMTLLICLFKKFLKYLQM